jgi:hypothetical protein
MKGRAFIEGATVAVRNSRIAKSARVSGRFTRAIAFGVGQTGFGFTSGARL